MKDWEKLKAGYWLDKFWAYLLHLKDNLTIAFHNPSFLPSAILAVGSILLIFLIRRIFNIRKTLKEHSVLLELTPPASVDKTAYTTSKLFSVIHDLGEKRTFWDKVLGRKILFSFEIVSTRQEGIRYLIRTTPDEVNNVKRNIISYLPQVSVKTVNEYLPLDKALRNYKSKVLEFKLRKRFGYPLQRQDALQEHDPVAYITGMMTKLSPGELISFQMVLSPTQTGEVNIIQNKILNNDNPLGYLDRVQPPWPIQIFLSLLMTIIRWAAALMGFIAWGVTDLVNGGRTRSYETQPRVRPQRILNVFEKETIESVQEKISQPLFETSIRLLVLVKDKKELRERTRGFVSSLGTFSVPKYQGLKVKFNFFPSLLDKIRLFTFRKRLLSLLSNKSPSLLSVSEISDLYHFPFQRVTQTENIVKAHSKELPAPLSLKQENNLDVIFAKNTYGGELTDIGLTAKDREKHMYMIGATGSGKSTMILSMIDHDIEKGRGICLIDPHGDLAEMVISTIPEKRKNDFIYVNPMDTKFPIGINLLELGQTQDEDELLLEKELVTESVISLFRKIFSEVWSAHAHRLEYILRNTIQTALTMEHPTIFTVYELLTNPDFAQNVIANLEDQNLKNFWKYEYGKAGDYQKVKMIGPITARIGRFLFSPTARRILEQEKSTINFDDIIDSGRILICNLAKGKIGEDNAEVLGIMILTKIQLASLRRVRQSQEARKLFYLYVDEFQHFATPSFIQMLSEARKYKLYLTLAEQSTSQQKDRNIVNVILANVGTVVSFKTANPDDERIMLAQFEPYVEKGEIFNLDEFKFYMKISAGHPQEPFSGETILTDVKNDKKKLQKLIQLSRDNFAIVYKKPEIKKEEPKTGNNGSEDRPKEEYVKPATYIT